MDKESLRDIARSYIAIIEAIEKTRDKSALIALEERRVIWHNKFIDALKKEGLPFRDREEVTRMAYRIAGEES